MTLQRLMTALLAAALMMATSVQAAPSAADLEAWQLTCKHYENRAKFQPRTSPLSPLVIMADSCADAIMHLEDPQTLTTMRIEAAQYLAQLTLLRETIISMNMQRVLGQSLQKDRRHVAGTHGMVTSTGEYLIAHQIGVIEAYHRWIARGGQDQERQARLNH